MGFHFRKSTNIGPFRINFSKSGVGFSAGARGFRVTKKATGGIRTTASIPGTGIAYVQDSKSTNHPNSKKKEESSVKKKISSAKSSKPKKPFYKKWWFWLIIGFVFIGGCFGEGDSTDDPSETTVPTTSYVEDTTEQTTPPDTTDAPTTAATTVPDETDPVETEPEETSIVTVTYVLNTSSDKFHEPSCASVEDIKDKNKATFTGTREEVIAKGYEPCGRCKP